MQKPVCELSSETRPVAICQISLVPGDRLVRSRPGTLLLTIFPVIRSKRPSALMAFSSGASNQRWHKARGFRLTRSRPAPRLRNNSRHRPVGPRKLPIRRHGVTPFKTEENFMTSKEEAELLFKQKPRSRGPRTIPQYEQRARPELT